MDEPRQHDRGASLTGPVRQFRRVARLAAADPLRLMPFDAIAQLAALSAPVADLIDLAPFERLRRAIPAPAAAPRRDPPRMRLQPLAGHDVPVKPTAAASALSPQVVSRSAPPAARQEPSSSLADMRRAGGPPGRDAASATTLAERRAALRRRAIDAGSSAGSASPFAAQAEPTGSHGMPQNDAPEIAAGARSRQAVAEEIGDQGRRPGPQSVDPVLFDLDNVTSPSNDLLASAALDPATHDTSFDVDPRTALPPTDWTSAPAALQQVGIPAGSETPAAALRSGPTDQGRSAVAHDSSSFLAGLPPQSARAPRADAGAAQRRRAWEPAGESELADALFETLYRDGVDLPWP